MNPVLTTLLVVVAVALIVVRHLLFERSMRRAEQNHTGIYALSPRGRRVAVVVIAIVGIGLIILRWRVAP